MDMDVPLYVSPIKKKNGSNITIQKEIKVITKCELQISYTSII
jgi:hypothetical protein